MPSDAPQTSRWQALQRGPLAVVLALAGLVLLFLLARSALDVLAVLLLCATIVLLERTIGDWFAERLGPMGGNVLFVVLVAALLWGLLGTNRGQDATNAVLRVGSERGFQSAVVPLRTPAGSRSTQSSVRRLPNQPTTPASTPVLASDGAAGPAGGVEPEAGVRLDENGAPGSSRSVEPANTQVSVRALPSDEPRQMVLKATVLAGPDAVTDGMVEFSLNGRVVARVALGSEGSAEARMANIAPGHYRVTARFAGTTDFREATSETTFTVG